MNQESINLRNRAGFLRHLWYCSRYFMYFQFRGRRTSIPDPTSRIMGTRLEIRGRRNTSPVREKRTPHRGLAATCVPPGVKEIFFHTLFLNFCMTKHCQSRGTNFTVFLRAQFYRLIKFSFTKRKFTASSKGLR